MNTTTTSPLLQKPSNGRIALLVTLGTESVFFLTLLVAYAALRNQVDWNVSHSFARLSIPLVNTMVLLLSTYIAWRALHSVRQSSPSALQNGLLITVILGVVFVAGQIYEFNHAGLQIDDQAFGGVFFTLIGFHAVHVLAGIVFLVLNLIRAYLNDFTTDHHEAVELGNWFWYYVTAVWLVLFAALYLL
jgi:cytochrome c oxidase subunit 3